MYLYIYIRIACYVWLHGDTYFLGKLICTYLQCVWYVYVYTYMPIYGIALHICVLYVQCFLSTVNVGTLSHLLLVFEVYGVTPNTLYIALHLAIYIEHFVAVWSIHVVLALYIFGCACKMVLCVATSIYIYNHHPFE